MRKAVAVPYIVGITLAIIVIAVLAYLFFSTAGKTTVTISSGECTAKKLQYCSSQQESDWTDMTKSCGTSAFNAQNSCYDYCSKIPGWSPTTGNIHCPKPTTTKP